MENVVYLCFPTSNRNFHLSIDIQNQLYIFVFLHQTATSAHESRGLPCCISLFSYIKPQHQGCHIVLHRSCISLFSYIKPQLRFCWRWCYGRCISLFSYIKPQLKSIRLWSTTSCISLFSYIKPQLREGKHGVSLVVYLCFPTSNRNCLSTRKLPQFVVYLCFPTSNRNCDPAVTMGDLLYIFVFLHQTATRAWNWRCNI